MGALNVKAVNFLMIGTLIVVGVISFIPGDTDADRTWESKHVYSDQWLSYDVGTLDQGTMIEYGVKVTTPDESVNVAFMDSTNYAAFSSDSSETFVGQDIQWQVRSREGEFEVPYQQQWYFVAISDSGYEIDIDYYVEVIDEDVAICGSVMFAGIILIAGAIFIFAYIRR